MNRIYKYALWLLGLWTVCWSQTIVDGETWTKANSPYHINSDIEIKNLIIEPGVDIIFDGDFDFTVTGLLLARGFYSDSICFYADVNNFSGWGGVLFDVNASSASVLEYCRISDARDGLTINAAKPDIRQSVISGNTGRGLVLNNSSIEFRNMVVRGNGNNGVHLNNAMVHLRNCIISGNGESGIFGILAADSINIENTVVSDNSGNGIFVPNGNLEGVNSIIYYNGIEITYDTEHTDLTYSSVNGAQVFPGAGNTKEKPSFTDRIKYELAANSKLIDAGSINTVYNDQFFPPSQGDVRNDMGAYGGALANYWYPPIYASSNPLDFGRVSKDSSVSRTLTLKNYRDETIQISSIDLKNNDDSPFSVNNTGMSILPGASRNIEVTFQPPAQDLYLDSIVVETSGFGEIYSVVEGQGVVAEIYLSSDILNFGATDLGSHPVRSLQITNTGLDTLRIFNAYTVKGQFTPDSETLKIAPASQSELAITFNPDSAKSYIDSLILINNDPDEGRYAVELLGSANGPVVQVDENDLNFGDIFFDHDTSLTINIGNLGNQSLTLNEVVADGPHGDAYQVTGFPPVINAGSEVQINVTFNPDTYFDSADTLLIKSGDPLRPVKKVALSGVARGAGFIAQPDSDLIFGAVLLEKPTRKNVVITNPGNFILDIQNVVFTTLPGEYNIVYRPEQIAVGGSDSVVVDFTPTITDTQHTGLRISYGLTPTASYSADFTASGFGAPGRGEVDRDTVDLGDNSLYLTKSSLFHIDNLGLPALQIDSIYFASHPRYMSMELPGFPVNIDSQGQSLAVPVSFYPVLEGRDSGAVNVVYRKTNQIEDTLVVQIKGTGLKPKLTRYTPQVMEFPRMAINKLLAFGFQVNNTGPGDLVLWRDSLQIVSDGYTPFQVKQEDSIVVVPPGENYWQIIPIHYRPDRIGEFLDTLVVVTSDRDTVPIVPVTSSAYDPDFAIMMVQDSALQFDSVWVGRQDTVLLEISNYFGGQELIIDSLVFGDDQSFGLLTDSLQFPLKIADAQKDTLSLLFHPQLGGPLETILQIYSNDKSGEPLPVTLGGVGLAASVSLPRSFSFGLTDSGTVKTLPFKIENAGTAPLVLPSDSVSWLDGDTASYSLDGFTGMDTIAPGNSLDAVIKYSPRAWGISSARLRLTSNDPLNRQIIVTMEGAARDPLPAQITPQSITDVSIGQGFSFQARVSTKAPVDWIRLYLRHSGSADYDSLEMTIVSGQSHMYETNIADEDVTASGLDFYLRVAHGYRISLYPDSAAKAPDYISVRIPALSMPTATKEGAYQMISLPVRTQGQTLNDLFGDDLGEYDNTLYRIFDCRDGETNVELEDMSDTLSPGHAFWLITKEPVQLSVGNARSVETNRSFIMHLRKGWNLIGSPFVFPVNWPDSAGVLRAYTGNSDWPETGILPPYGGVAVKAESDTEVVLQPVDAGSMPKSTVIESGLKIQIKVESEVDRDRFNFALASPADSMPLIDRFEPPPIGTYNRIYFTGESSKRKLSTLIQPENENGYRFKFRLEANHNEEKTVSIKTIRIPENMGWAVISPATGLIYRQEFKTTSILREFILVVGTESYLNESTAGYRTVPEKFVLTQNYPNPFNPSTRAELQLPGGSRFDVHIYNILGQKVKTLIKNRQLDAGYHLLKWDGRNDHGEKSASGMYILRASSPVFTKAIRMILQR